MLLLALPEGCLRTLLKAFALERLAMCRYQAKFHRELVRAKKVQVGSSKPDCVLVLWACGLG